MNSLSSTIISFFGLWAYLIAEGLILLIYIIESGKVEDDNFVSTFLSYSLKS